MVQTASAGFSETSGDTLAFLGITISIDPVIKEKESIFKFAKILPYTRNHTVLQEKEYKQTLAVQSKSSL